MASGSVNEILDGIADVQEFRDSVILDYLDDLTIPDHTESVSSEEVSTIKKKPLFKPNYSKKTNTASTAMNTVTESDFINQALSGSGRLSRSNSANQLAKSSSNEMQKVMHKEL